MILFGKALACGLIFVLDAIARAVDKELNDVSRLREALMDAQLRFEIGELDRDELEAVEAQILGRLGEISDKEEPAALDVRSVRVMVPELPADVTADGQVAPNRVLNGAAVGARERGAAAKGRADSVGGEARGGACGGAPRAAGGAARGGRAGERRARQGEARGGSAARGRGGPRGGAPRAAGGAARGERRARQGGRSRRPGGARRAGVSNKGAVRDGPHAGPRWQQTGPKNGRATMSLTYVYCLLQAKRPPSVAGIGQKLPRAGRVRLENLDEGLWLVVATVPSAEYGAEPIKRALNDADWLSQCAVGHEQVVDACLRRGTVIPLRLFTLFRDDGRAVADMRTRRIEIERALERVAGCHEWGLRIGFAGVVRSEAPSRSAPTGRAFLEGKRSAAVARSNALCEARRAADEAYDSIRRLSRENLVRPISTTASSHEAGGHALSRLLLDAVLLVAVPRSGLFRVALDTHTRRLHEVGCNMRVTGPWPAYSFVG